MPRTPALIPLALLMLGVACSEPDATETPDGGTLDADAEADVGPLPTARTTDCDALMPSYCALPWPSNLYLKEDAAQQTGYALDFGDSSLPKSRQDHIAPDAYRRLDGYGPGSPIITLFPDIDVSQMAGEDSIERSLEDEDRQIFLLRVADQGVEHVPYWAELDSQAPSSDKQVLYIRPAVILELDSRYIVAMRNLTTTGGQPIAPSAAFEAYRSGQAADDPELAWRQERFDEIFALLQDQGVAPEELTLAWDFHTSSSQALHGPARSMVSDALHAIEETPVEFTIDILTVNTPEEHPHIALDILGTFTVPSFVTRSERAPAEGYLLNRNDDGTISQQGTHQSTFWLRIPHSALDGTPHGLVKYGHGMLGSGEEVTYGSNHVAKIAHEKHLIFFATTFAGFSQRDIPLAGYALQHATYFEELVDRMHQGLVDYAVLTRAMRDGLTEIAELADYNLQVNPEELYYMGISQGGIYGVSFLALTPDVERAHLGVPGANYAMLLERSANFATYFTFLKLGYPDRVDQELAIAAIQLLWDSVDPISYLRHIDQEPFYPGDKRALFAPAKGDYQVAVVTNEIAARTDIGIPLMRPYDSEREPWGVPTAEYPRAGSGVVLYDFGNPWPAPGPQPPEDELGDPHTLPRRLTEHQEQMVHFWRTGEIIDVCQGGPCVFGRD
ncbi:hypothetical protein DL240_07365 [Lujinxingia litoralis]|uniref:Uncharacterized protein n=1 Tax=Lujinxingia litoralis TaxID=2211119 RepID=A0A328CBT0_9DELT|nr:hypothetical protein [Lujinxingia litoralis]RAL23959.1 hypothetical protein DL240_07365 [Lujinxingia litoralis]